MRSIDADYLIKEFTDRARATRNWKERALNSGNEESAIRADAVLSILTEVKLTIDNAPTVDITEEQAIDKLHETGWMQKHDKEMTARPTGERKCKTCKYCDGEIFNKHCGECSHAWPDLYEEAENG